MCNAWNHSPDCACGWGGDGHRGKSLGGWASSTVRTVDPRKATLADRPFGSSDKPNAYCPVCGAAVYFYQSPTGGRVFFDDLGHPWPKHPCTARPHVVVKLRTSAIQEPASRAPSTRPAAVNREWVPIQISAPQWEDRYRVVSCRDLITDQRFKVYVERGFALDGAAVASMTPWTSSGWTMLSICRLDSDSSPLLLTGKRDAGVGPMSRTPEFHKRFKVEYARLQQPLIEARRQREEAAKRARRERELEDARERARAIIAEVEALRGGDLAAGAARRVAALENQWGRNASHLDKSDTGLKRNFTDAVWAFKERLEHERQSQAAEQKRARRLTLTRQAEALADSGPWETIAPRFRDLAEAWKATGEVTEPDAAAQWRRFHTAFLIARESENRAGVRSKLQLLDSLEHLAAASHLEDQERLNRLRGAMDQWWAAGRVQPHIASNLQAQFLPALATVLRTVDVSTLQDYEARLHAEVAGARLRGARPEDLPIDAELKAVHSVLVERHRDNPGTSLVQERK